MTIFLTLFFHLVDRELKVIGSITVIGFNRFVSYPEGFKLLLLEKVEIKNATKENI